MAPTDDSGQGPRRQESLVVLGRISGVYGVNGWVKLHSYTDPRQAILDYRTCTLTDASGDARVQIAEGKPHGKGLVARLVGIDNRDAAAALVGKELAVPRGEMPELSDGHYYWADLEGLTVRRPDGTVLGKVAYLLATGANDVLVVQGEKEILIPFLWGTVVLEVDREAAMVTVDWEWD